MAINHLKYDNRLADLKQYYENITAGMVKYLNNKIDIYFKYSV